MKNKSVSRIALVILLCGFLPAVSSGQLITISISGQVTNISDPCSHLENKIHIGDTITGTYTYDSATLDSNPDTTEGLFEYNTPPAGIYLSVGGFEFKTDINRVDFLLAVTNNNLTGDYYNILSRNNLPLPNGTLVQYINWELYDPTGIALSSDALPLTAPDLSKWNSNLLRITHDRDFTIDATVTSAVLIPEPATLLLIIFGVAICKRR